MKCRKTILRGKILHYLATIHPEAATLPLVHGRLHIFGLITSLEEVRLQIAYLSEKGFVVAERVKTHRGQREVNLVRITTKGMDYLDGLLPADPAISLGPRNQ